MLKVGDYVQSDDECNVIGILHKVELEPDRVTGIHQHVYWIKILSAPDKIPIIRMNKKLNLYRASKVLFATPAQVLEARIIASLVREET